MKNKGLYILLWIVFLSLTLLAFSACGAEEGRPVSQTETTPSTEIAATEENAEEPKTSPFSPPTTVTMYCEKGEENGRPDMTHLFLSFRYESVTDEASGLRYHRLWRICHDCGKEVDFGTTRCKTNSPFCEAGCV